MSNAQCLTFTSTFNPLTLDAWRLTLDIYVKVNFRDAWRLPLTHIAAPVKPSMQNSAYTTTRENMQAPARHRKGQRIPHKPAHVKHLRETCEAPAHITLRAACQAPIRHLPAHTTKAQPSQARTKFRPCQAIYFRAGYWQALAGYAIMSRGGY